jgi:muramoyltetrapeptide carboxypeptidase
MVGTTFAGDGFDTETAGSLFEALQGRPRPVAGRMVVEGEARGVLVGGNLSLLAHSVGTPWQADFQDAIVLLEDIGEAPYRIDRMLTQLLLAGLFDQARGIVLGQWTDCDPPEKADFTVEDVLLERLGGLGIPVMAGVPVGHEAHNVAVPLGSQARITSGRLSFDQR